MATVNVLPASLREKLDAVARHVRYLHTVRGVCLTLLVLALAAGMALLADAVLELGTAIRVALLGGWLVLALALLVFGLVIPLSRRLDAETIAAAVEEKYPDLGERLTTAVEVAGLKDDIHGSPALIAVIVSETEARARRLDFPSAVPARYTKVLAAVALAVLLFLAAPALVAPAQYSQLSERFLMPWKKPPVVVPFAIEVTPGDSKAAIGAPLTLSAAVHPLHANAVLPKTSTLVMTDEQGNVSRQRMTADRSDEFSLKVDHVPGSFTYFVEADGIRSSTHQIRGVEPVELSADSPAITVTAPTYARATFEDQHVNGSAALSVLQHSTINFEFRFSRPAAQAKLEWVAEGREKDTKAYQPVPLVMAEDGQSATGQFVATGREPGHFRVTLEAEPDIDTVEKLCTVAVILDKPPAFSKVSGNDEIKAVLAYDRVPLQIEISDDVGVERAELEYRINSGASHFEPIALDGQNTMTAKANYSFALGGKVKEGDEVAYRLKAYDNRNVADLKPQSAYYPTEGWRRLKIASSAQPLREQEIQAQHDSINKKLQAIQDELVREERGVYKIQQETRKQDALSRDQSDDLKSLKKTNSAIEKALRDVGREASEAGLPKIGDIAANLADEEMTRSAKDLSDASNQKKPDPRTESFAKSDKELIDAYKKLEDLKKLNDKTAQDKLDLAKLELAAGAAKRNSPSVPRNWPPRIRFAIPTPRRTPSNSSVSKKNWPTN